MTSSDDLQRRLQTDDDCLQYLFEVRFPNPPCQCCGRRGQFYRHRGKQCFTCACGRRHIFPRQGTVFEQSPLPLSTWFDAIRVLAEASPRPTISALARRWHVAYATGWRMTHRIDERLQQHARPTSFDEALAAVIGLG